MTKIALMDKPISQLTARSTVAGTDRLPIFTSTGTEAQAATVDQIVASSSGILDNNNAFTGNNTFAGTTGLNGNTTLATGKTLTITDVAGLKIGGVANTSSAAEINILTGATLTVTELNRLDDSAEVETIDSGVEVSVTKFNTIIDNTITGTGAITLAACPSTMVGKIKTIRMGVDNGDVTLALTNVQGQTSGTTATFEDVGDELILVGSAGGKWTVIKELGIALS